MTFSENSCGADRYHSFHIPLQPRAFACAGVALEAIYFHCFITMACHAKTVFARDHAIVLHAGMALDAILQTALFLAHALAHRFVALMLEQMHVVLAHPLHIFHALAALADVQLGRVCPGSQGRRDAQTEQQGCEQLHYSPSPIWIYPVGHTSAQIWQPMHLS